MKRLFNVALIATLAMIVCSCKPSVVGEWKLVRTAIFDNEELVESLEFEDGQEDVMIMRLDKDGTGYSSEGEEGYEIYWKMVDEKLYIDAEPIVEEELEEWDDTEAAKVKTLDRKTLQLQYEANFILPEIELTFVRVK